MNSAIYTALHSLNGKGSDILRGYAAPSQSAPWIPTLQKLADEGNKVAITLIHQGVPATDTFRKAQDDTRTAITKLNIEHGRQP
jgi:hypothetical protein